MLPPSGNLFKCHEEVLYLQPLIPPKRFDWHFSPWLGDAQKVKARSDLSLKYAGETFIICQRYVWLHHHKKANLSRFQISGQIYVFHCLRCVCYVSYVRARFISMGQYFFFICVAFSPARLPRSSRLPAPTAWHFPLLICPNRRDHHQQPQQVEPCNKNYADFSEIWRPLGNRTVCGVVTYCAPLFLHEETKCHYNGAGVCQSSPTLRTVPHWVMESLIRGINL